MSNKQKYQDAFDKITMSEDAFQRVKSMEGNMVQNTIKKSRIAVRFAVGFAAAAVIFIGSNMAVDAATGSSLVEKAVVLINGKKLDANVKRSVDEDGNAVYQYKLDSGAECEVAVAPDAEGKFEFQIENDSDETKITISEKVTGKKKELTGTLEQEGEKIYLKIKDKKEDITEDFADGEAKGSISLNGEKYRYTVKGTVEESEINIIKAE